MTAPATLHPVQIVLSNNIQHDMMCIINRGFGRYFESQQYADPCEIWNRIGSVFASHIETLAKWAVSEDNPDARSIAILYDNCGNDWATDVRIAATRYLFHDHDWELDRGNKANVFAFAQRIKDALT